MGESEQPTIRVGGFVVVDARLLLVRQHRLTDRDGGSYWLLPGGGVCFGESLEEALARELREELAIEVIPERPIALLQSISPDANYSKHVVHIVLLARPAHPGATLEPQPVDRTVLEARLFSPGELLSLPIRPPFAADLVRYMSAPPPDVEYLGRRW